MSIEFSSRVRANYQSLSRTEQKIADYLLENASEARYFSIQELSQKIGISMSAISRFTKKIGFNNYQDMRMHLYDSISDPTNPFFITFDKNDSMMKIAMDTFRSGQASLTSTMTVLSEDKLNASIHILKKAGVCGIFGLGGSAVMALNAYHRFIRTSLNCCYAQDYHMQLMNAGTLKRGDCALIISHTGKNKDILRIVDILNKKHVSIISITSNASSPLAKKSEVVLTSISEETEFRPEAVSSMISQLMLIDTLFTLFAVKVDNDPKRLKAIREIVNTTRI